MAQDLEIGVSVRIHNQPGIYVIKGHNKDGSYSLYGGTLTHRSFRDVMPKSVKQIKTPKEPKK